MRKRISAFGVTNDSWTESGINWNNAPAIVPGRIGGASCTFDEKYYEIDVTDFVRAQLAGDKIVSLALKDTAIQDKKVTFRSRESAIYKPQLVITIDTITTTSSRPVISSAPVQKSPAGPSCDDPSAVVIPADNPGLRLTLANNPESPKVYPNPVHKRFNIQFSRQHEGNVTLQIADAVGKTFEIGKYQLKPGGTNIEINISNLSLKPGAYFLKINSAVKTEVRKLIVQ